MWFLEDVAVDHAALAHLQDVALLTAMRLQEASQLRPQIAARNLARCAGPFAEDLADHVLRLADHHLELADALVALAATAATASRDAQQEQVRRVQLRIDYQEAQAARALDQFATAALTGTWSTATTAATPAIGASSPWAPL